jgi:D-serine deaminase-like pyridoxal phosphate-dependent protein
LEHPDMAKRWNNNYLISLSIDSEQSLHHLLEKLKDTGVSVSYFLEPDIGNEMTSLCFLEIPETKKLTNKLKLSLND